MQTSCSRGLQASPALTLPLAEADVDARDGKAESTQLGLNQIPVRKGGTQHSGGPGVRVVGCEKRAQMGQKQQRGQVPPT